MLAVGYFNLEIKETKSLVYYGTVMAQDYGGSVEESFSLDTSDEDGRSWLSPHSEPGALQQAPLPSTLVRIYYLDSEACK